MKCRKAKLGLQGVSGFQTPKSSLGVKTVSLRFNFLYDMNKNRYVFFYLYRNNANYITNAK